MKNKETNMSIGETQGGKHRVLAATGLVATAAVGGLGMAAVTAAEAQAASGVVHACYSKSTHALKYTKKASCAKGSKLVTWNKQGPQGAAGAPGAQGPAGPTTAFAGEVNYQDSEFASSTPTVAASFTPTSAGYFAVNGFAGVYGNDNAYYRCWDEGGTGTGNTDYTPPDTVFIYTGQQVGVPTGGILTAGPTTPVYEYCSGSSPGYVYEGAQVTGIHLNAAHVAATAAKAPLGKIGAAKFKSKPGKKG